MVVSVKGFGKRTDITYETGEDVYRITNRGGKGVKTINVTDKTGSLVGILDVTENEDLMITCKSGVTIRMAASQVSEQGRATQGVKLIRLDEDDAIAAITTLARYEAENGNEETGNPAPDANNAPDIANNDDASDNEVTPS